MSTTNGFFLDVNLRNIPADGLANALQTILNQLEDQLNGAGLNSFGGILNDTQHGERAGGNLHPLATQSVQGFMSTGDKVKANNYLGDTSAAGPADLTTYPNDGNWGFHTDTAGVTYSLAKNKAGTVYTVALT